MAAIYPLDTYEPTDWYVPVRPAPRPAEAVYRRRRLVVLAAAVVVLVILGLRLGSALGSVPASAPERLPVPATYTVRAGDTLWSIASSLQPDGDVRDLVSRLIAANGGDTIRPGQILGLPAG
jgi:nucleoid-associated protein YgaU